MTTPRSLASEFNQEGSVVILQAEAFCIAAHSAIGQKRKYTGEPYWHHPFEVAQVIHSNVIDAPLSLIVAAYLHDVVEDTEVTLETIEMVFGKDVADLVEGVTDRSSPTDGNRRTRKAQKRERMRVAPPLVQTLCLADTFANVKDISDMNPKFAEVYIPEKQALLPCLVAGDRVLYQLVKDVLELRTATKK